MAASGGKQYGLIMPQKRSSKSSFFARPSVFGDDSDEEASVGETLQKEALKKKKMKQTHLEMQKALEEDSSVYEYDNVYEDIQEQKFESNKKLLGGTDKKPKYIKQLMQAVEERKKEQERREERKIQKEREAEGEKFADKEAYVTSAYRQKLKDRQEELEKERRAAEMEAALDVKKQKDLSGFYRHLLNQTVGEEPVPNQSTERPDRSKTGKSSAVNFSPQVNYRDEEPHSDKDQRSKAEFGKTSGDSNHSKRRYRQRSPSSGSDYQEERKQEKVQRRNKERDREKEDKHGHQKEDRGDTNWHREEDRGREGRDREEDGEREGRGRVRDKEDGYGKRSRVESSTNMRDHNRHEERRKDRHRESDYCKTDDKEKRKQAEKEKEKTQGNGKEKDIKAAGGAQIVVKQVTKFAKRSSEQTVSSARERFLARQMARSAAKPYIEKEDNEQLSVTGQN